MAVVHSAEADVGDGTIEVSNLKVSTKALQRFVPRFWKLARRHGDATSWRPTGGHHDVGVVEKPVPISHRIESATARYVIVDSEWTTRRSMGSDRDRYSVKWNRPVVQTSRSRHASSLVTKYILLQSFTPIRYLM